MRSMAMRKSVRMAMAAAAIGISVGIAAPAGASQKGENYPGGEATFKEECQMAGGSFYRDPGSGAIRCRWDNGTIIMCDKGAKNCTTHATAKLLANGGAATYQGSALVVAR